MKSLGKEDDVRTSKASMESSSAFLKIPDKRTPWYLLSLAYQDGYAHWIEMPGRKERVVCLGGIEGKGFDTENCPICAHVLELYNEAKAQAEAGNEKKSKAIKTKANDMRGKFEAHFLAVRGERVMVKKEGQKKYIADFDQTSEDCEIGVLSMSPAQFKSLTGLIGDDSFEFIKSGDDLGNRVLWSVKEKRQGKSAQYTEVVWRPDTHTRKVPKLDYDEEDFDLAGDFEADEEEVEKVMHVLLGDSEDVSEDEDVDLDNDSEDVDNDYLDDVDDDSEDATDDDAVDGDDSDDDFEDDLPYDEDEPEDKEPPKKSKKDKVGKGKKGKKRSGKSKL